MENGIIIWQTKKYFALFFASLKNFVIFKWYFLGTPVLLQIECFYESALCKILHKRLLLNFFSFKLVPEVCALFMKNLKQ